MEMTTFSLELTNDNYEDWSVKMKNKLMARDLWDIVEKGLETPKPDDHEVEYEVRRKMNDVALLAIQRSCRKDILDQISNICSAKIAWETLDKMFIENNGKGKQIQMEAHQIIDEGSSSHNPDEGSSSHNPEQERKDGYAALLKAVRGGDWETTSAFLELHPAALTEHILPMGGTVLFVAVDAEQEHIVEKLVYMMAPVHLELKNYFGLTALHLAMTSENQRIAELLIRSDSQLVSLPNHSGALPVTMAMGFGHKELARYVYSQTPLQDLLAEAQAGRCEGARLLNGSIYNRDLDMALDLVKRCPRLAFAFDPEGISPLGVLAVSTEEFESENQLVFWKRWIYNHCIHISLDRAVDQFPLNIQNYQEKIIRPGIHDNDIISGVGATGLVRADHLWRQLVSSLSNLFGFKRLYELKLVQAQFQQLLYRMCEAIPTNANLDMQHEIILPLIDNAVSRGNFKFVEQIVEVDSSFMWIRDTDGRDMFQLAVLHRQHRIFGLPFKTKWKKRVLSSVDYSMNTMLHLAAMLPYYSSIDHISGAALQMQREVQWFKEVEKVCPFSHTGMLNKDGYTARQLFTKHHEEMRKEGERWMKDMATSCTVVSALIITITFAAAFTIPGGNNQNTGLPILLPDKLFTLFIVTNSVSLFASSTSVLMFSGIFISRYAEEDFLESLPKKIIIGLFALFISIITMMIAFSTVLWLMLRGKYWIVVPIIGLAGVPIIIFLKVQFLFLIDMLVSTYGSSIFDRKRKRLF